MHQPAFYVLMITAQYVFHDSHGTEQFYVLEGTADSHLSDLMLFQPGDVFALKGDLPFGRFVDSGNGIEKG